MANDSKFLRHVVALAGKIGELHQHALAEYSSIVSIILRSGSRDAGEIECTLDGLHDFFGHEAVLRLYRRLCRHYHGIDPAAATSYVHAYRAMYDDDPASGGEG